MSSETKTCKNCKQEFRIEPEDFKFYEKMKVPPPTLCFHCRLQRKMAFRNERTFYKRKCDLCERGVVSSYAPEYTHPVYCQKCWWSDKWDPFDYGRDFDFSRPFSDQYKELLYEVPVISLMNDDTISSVNSEYTYDWAYDKNSYLSTCGWYNENIAYVYHVNYSKDITDAFHVNHSELMYQSMICEKCYGCGYCMFCFDCRDCILGLDLKNCSDCIMCVGLRHKQYCIFNKQYSKEEYFRKKSEMRLESREAIKKYRREFQELVLRSPRKFAMITRSVNSTGDNLINCKNSKNCFYYPDLEDCRYMVVGDGAKDTYDCVNTGHPVLSYEGITPDNTYGSIATIFCWQCNQVEYSNNCHSSNNLFGCSALKKASYAIFNKKYSKEEYLKMRERIIAHMKETGEWGEFFPISMSPYAYNESAAQEWFTLSEAEAKQKGFRWRTPEPKNYQITLPSDQVPDTISEVGDDILNQVIGCAHEAQCNEQCTTAFKIIPMELAFCRKMGIPLPTLCPNCRHYERLKLRNPVRLWHRQCTCGGQKSDNGVYQNTTAHFHGNNHCSTEFETTYAPERKEVVYCEQCYQSEVA